MHHSLLLYLYVIRLQIRTRLQYRANLVIGWVAQAFGYASVYGTIWIIANRFERIGGWTWPEIALMLGFHLLGYALGAIFTLVQFRSMEELVRLGTYDALLTRPVNTWAFIVLSGVNIEYGGHIALGIGMITWSIIQLDIDLSILTFFYLVASLFSAALLTGAILTIIGATALVLNRSRHLLGIYFDFWELARYPLTIFALPLQLALLSVAPLGYMAYVPVAALLGKPLPILGELSSLAAILSGPAMAVISILVWHACHRHYQSAGG